MAFSKDPIYFQLLKIISHCNFCPSCGTPTRLDRADNNDLVRFKAHKALTCGICGAMYQLASRKDILRAATISGGDMIEYFVGDDGQEGSGNGRSK